MIKYFLAFLLLSLALTSFSDERMAVDIAIEDGEVKISKTELVNATKYLPKTIREEAAKYDGSRYELLNQMMLNKKIANIMKAITPESHPELYWKREFAIRNMQIKIYLDDFKEKLKVPDMTELAKERYKVNSENFAKIPEKRRSSHILFKCMGKDCERDEFRPKVEDVLKKLNEGISFEEMVKEHSDDEGSKARDGKMDSKFYFGQPKVSAAFLAGLFKIEKEGGYSGVVESRFGFHIIRLDEIFEKSYKTFEKVGPGLIAALEGKFKALSLKNLVKDLSLTENAKISETVMKEVFAPYLVEEKKVVKKKNGKFTIKRKSDLVD